MCRRSGDNKKKGCTIGNAENQGQIRRSPRLSVSLISTSSGRGRGGKGRQQSKSRACSTTAATSSSSNSKRSKPTTSNKEQSFLFDHSDDDDHDYDEHQDPVDLHPAPVNISCSQSKSLELVQRQHPLKEVDRSAYHDDHPINDESWLPEKRILELVLDKLQRRDTYEIFAEPVDPSEVEEYYEIIKEPMDFGTMRAKLHEGMYKNLQQFERDIFLIFDNAMHFNPPATIYFRQARALEDLAKEVFHVLRSGPENFELEFAPTKRRSCRKLNEQRDSNFESLLKLEKDLSSGKMNANMGQQGKRRARKSYMTEFDRRCTYKPRISLLDEIDSTISSIYYGTESLIHVNQQDIGYEGSLMLFAKELGPTAKRVAKRKVQGLWKIAPSSIDTNDCWDPTSRVAANCENPASQSFSQRKPQQTYNNIIHTKTLSGHSIVGNDVMKLKGVNMSREGNQDEETGVGFTRLIDNSSAPANAIWGSRSRSDCKFDLNQVQCVSVSPSPSPSSWGCHGICNFRSPSPCPASALDDALTKAAVVSRSATVNDIKKRHPLPPAQPRPPPHPPVTDQFTFSLPYLKYMLSQLNESD